MRKFKLIKKLIADISNNEEYNGIIYKGPVYNNGIDYFFIIENKPLWF